MPTDHILTSCPTYADMRNEVLWNEAREPDYRRILCQGSLVKKAAQFMLRTRLLGQLRTLPPTESQPAARTLGPQFACCLALKKYADPHALSPSGHIIINNNNNTRHKKAKRMSNIDKLLELQDNSDV